jgi:hypothetical protein
MVNFYSNLFKNYIFIQIYLKNIFLFKGQISTTITNFIFDKLKFKRGSEIFESCNNTLLKVFLLFIALKKNL